MRKSDVLRSQFFKSVTLGFRQKMPIFVCGAQLLATLSSKKNGSEYDISQWWVKFFELSQEQWYISYRYKKSPTLASLAFFVDFNKCLKTLKLKHLKLDLILAVFASFASGYCYKWIKYSLKLSYFLALSVTYRPNHTVRMIWAQV